MVSAVFALIGVVIGFLGTYLIHRQDRKDKYLFALVEERFRIAQEAYELCQVFKHIVHGEEKMKLEVLRSSRDWFNKNNLYLSPDIRNDFDETIHNIYNYRDKLEEYYVVKHEGHEERTEQLKTELALSFSLIMNLGERVQKSMDRYYDIIKPFDVM